MDTINLLAQIVNLYRETVRSALGEAEARRFDKHPLIVEARTHLFEAGEESGVLEKIAFNVMERNIKNVAEITNPGVPEVRRHFDPLGSSTTIPVPNPKSKGD